MSRIVAGSHRGRRIAVPPGSRTRPTTDRVREALFSALAAEGGTAASPPDRALAGRSFCDLYAGSGAVALEAASRGAQPVLAVEADRRTAQLIRRNTTDLGLAVDVRPARVEQVLTERAPRPFDLVFADPPYELASSDLDAAIALMTRTGWVAEGSLVVLERARRSAAPVWPAVFAECWSRSYGETMLYFGAWPA